MAAKKETPHLLTKHGVGDRPLLPQPQAQTQHHHPQQKLGMAAMASGQAGGPMVMEGEATSHGATNKPQQRHHLVSPWVREAQRSEDDGSEKVGEDNATPKAGRNRELPQNSPASSARH